MRARLGLWVVKSPSPPVSEFEAFACQSQPFLFGALRKFCGGMEGDLEDIVHDVLLRALLRWEQLRRLEAPAQRAWLARVAHNCFMDRCRRRGSEKNRLKALLELHEESEQSDERREPELWELVEKEDLLEALKHVSPVLSRTFELHLEGLSYKEIGRVTGVEAATVGARLTRARQELRELLRETAEKLRGERTR